MRKYTAKFVSTRLFQRLHNAACPFPGKYPLRLFYKVNGVVKYHGKFHPSVWKYVMKQPIPVPGGSSYLAYDKAGAVIWGLSPRMLSTTNESLLYRYFARTYIDGDMGDLTVETIGPYKVYLNDGDRSIGDRPLDRLRFLNYVNRNIGHIRNV